MSGGRFIGLRFKPGILGRLTADLDEAAKVVQIINTLIAKGTVAGA